MIHEHKFLKLRDGVEIRVQTQENAKQNWLIIVHGIGEHLGRHQHLQELLGPYYNLCFFDLRGHGKSFGERAYVENFSDYRKDLAELITHLKNEYQLKSYALFGHSMGGLIVADFLQHSEEWHSSLSHPKKSFLSSPPVGFGGKLGKLVGLVPHEIVQKVKGLPLSIEIGGLVDLNNFSHNPEIKEQFLQDQDVCLKLHTKLLLELINASKRVFSRPLRSHGPVYSIIGQADHIADPTALKSYVSNIDKSLQLKIIEEAMHELHNEVQRYRTPYEEYLLETMGQGDY